jgi:heme a synthase
MPGAVPPIELAPLLRVALLALTVASLPLTWVWLRQGGTNPTRRLAALTTLTLFLTFDLIVFGSFTRLSDSGLGCPDWPGCYGEASPIGARGDIDAAEAAMPGGPVTWGKAWIEMVHRYVAMTVGVLILVMAAFAWRERARASATLPLSPWWPTATLAWVIVQGLFGKYTVTLKLHPAIVTLHLLGGLLLLAMLALQHESFRRQPLTLAPRLRRWAWIGAVLLTLQVALGGWVSTNYAVLACSGFPACNGRWWPDMEFARAFTLLRPLGHASDGTLLGFESLVGIHMLHRLAALLVLTVLLQLAWRLRRSGDPQLARFGSGLGLLALAQLASGLSNVVLGWPMIAALVHSAGAAAMVLLLTMLLARSGAAAAWAPATAAPRPRATGSFRPIDSSAG